MNHIEFIEKNIKQALVKLGYSESVSQSGAYQGVDLYKRCSQASKKGGMFDDCLRHAKLWADKYSLPDEKPGKKPRAKRKPAAPSLF